MIFDTEAERKKHESFYEHYKCEPCGLSFFKMEQLSEHRRDETCKDLLCPLCGFGAHLPIETRYSRVNEHKRRCLTGKKGQVQTFDRRIKAYFCSFVDQLQ